MRNKNEVLEEAVISAIDNFANKAMLKGYQEHPTVFQNLVSKGANRDFKAFLNLIGVPATFVTAPGVHDFNFWRTHLEKGLIWALEPENFAKM